MSKMIIHNRAELSDVRAMFLILSVVKEGRISKTSRGEQYCFVCTADDCVIYARRTKGGTDTFTLTKKP